jgi:ketosteroid isomerase-like protein
MERNAPRAARASPWRVPARAHSIRCIEGPARCISVHAADEASNSTSGVDKDAVMSPPFVRLVLVLLSASVALAPRATAAESSARPAAVGVAVSQAPGPGARGAVVTADDAFAARVARDGWTAGLSASLADDGVYLHPGADLVEGRAAVQGVLAQAQQPWRTPALHRLAAGSSADGERGYSWGWLEEVEASGRRFGRYLAAWKRAGTAWRIDALVLTLAREATASPPAQGALARGYAGTARRGDPAALRAQVFEADRAFAAHARTIAAVQGFGPAFGAFADPGAAFASQAGVLWEAEAIRAGVKTDPGEALEWEPALGAAAASGDLAWTSGRAVYRAEGKEAFTKYLTIWARQPDGSWRWLLDAGNLRPAAAP